MSGWLPAWKAFCLAALFCMGCTVTAMASSPWRALGKGALLAFAGLVLLVLIVALGHALRAVFPSQGLVAARAAVATLWVVFVAHLAPTALAAILYLALWIGTLHTMRATWEGSFPSPHEMTVVCGMASALLLVGAAAGLLAGASLESAPQLEGLLLLNLALPGMAALGVRFCMRVREWRAAGVAAGEGLPAAAILPTEARAVAPGLQRDASFAGQPEPTVDGFKVVCEELADAFRLTGREREMLVHLARGHKPLYCARLLYISESTARTHVRNIYRKTGVNSHEQLIQLVEEQVARLKRG